MSLITTTNLSKSFGPVDLFRGLNFAIPRGARLALVGPNGIGKTTLLRILAGEEEPSGGKVARARNIRIGHLPQEAAFEMEGTLWEACLAVFAPLLRQGEELARLEAEMSDPGRREAALARYGRLQEDFERSGGYTYPTRIRQVLGGLGFDEADHNLPLEHLSGGQRTRAYLAHLLLSDPDLLLLDEPTNHLDIAAVEWLEGYLSQWQGAAVLVSHDRYFLDKVANGILEMTASAFEMYHGNYSAYLGQRQERAERRQEVFEAEKEKLLKEVEYIKRNISGQNVAQAKGKLRRLSRIVQAIEQAGFEAVLNQKWIKISEEVNITTSPFGVEEAERRVRALRSPVRALPHLKLHLSAEKRSGDLVIRTHDLQVGYPGKMLFCAPDIVLRRRECAALIGPNGAGKTTFLKTILGQVEPLAGEVVLGGSLNTGYFAQAHEGLKPENTLMQEIESAAPGMLPGQVRDHLGRYLFSGDEAFKKVSLLSGGERGRLALAKLALQQTNLLLLDEPTNHLDVPSQEVLQSVLDEYGGTILLVTHDRYLIDALGTQIWEIDPGETRLTLFEGTYSQMKEARQREAARLAPAQAHAARSRAATRSPRVSMKKQGRSSKDEHLRATRLQKVEKQIATLEAQLSEIGRQLEQPPADIAEVRRLGEAYTAIQNQIEALLAEWGNLSV